jgi:hypothetical protein
MFRFIYVCNGGPETDGSSADSPGLRSAPLTSNKASRVTYVRALEGMKGAVGGRRHVCGVVRARFVGYVCIALV